MPGAALSGVVSVDATEDGLAELGDGLDRGPPASSEDVAADPNEQHPGGKLAVDEQDLLAGILDIGFIAIDGPCECSA